MPSPTRRWVLPALLLGTAMLAAVGCCVLLPPNPAPSLPRRWSPAAARVDAPWHPIASPLGAFELEHAHFAWTRHGPVGMESRRGHGVPRDLRLVRPCADGTTHRSVPLPDGEYLIAAARNRAGEERVAVLQQPQATRLLLTVFDGADLRQLHQWSWDTGRASQALIRGLHGLTDGRLACIVGHLGDERPRARLLHVDPFALAMVGEVSLDPIELWMMPSVQVGDVLRLRSILTPGLDLASGVLAPPRPLTMPLAVSRLSPPRPPGWGASESQFIGFEPDMVLAIEKSTPPWMAFNPGQPQALTLAGKLYTELLWQLPNRRTRAAQRHATHLEAVTLSAPGRTTQRLEGDLLRTLRRGDRDALEAFLVPGEGLLLVQGVEGPPAALGCPQGLLRFGLLRPMDRQVDWFVWTPLPFEQLEMLHAIEANVYIDGGDLVGVVWLYGATANGELSRSAWLQLPGPDGVALPAGTWLSPVRAS